MYRYVWNDPVNEVDLLGLKKGGKGGPAQEEFMDPIDSPKDWAADVAGDIIINNLERMEREKAARKQQERADTCQEVFERKASLCDRIKCEKDRIACYKRALQFMKRSFCFRGLSGAGVGIVVAMKHIVRRAIEILSNTDQPVLHYVAKVSLMLILTNFPIYIAVKQTISHSANSHESLILLRILLMLFFSPWCETLLLWLLLWIMKHVFNDSIGIAIMSALIWAVLHSFNGLSGGLISMLPWFVFSICFLEWERRSKGKAIVTTALVHTFYNIPAAVFYMLQEEEWGD